MFSWHVTKWVVIMIKECKIPIPHNGTSIIGDVVPHDSPRNIGIGHIWLIEKGGVKHADCSAFVLNAAAKSIFIEFSAS